MASKKEEGSVTEEEGESVQSEEGSSSSVSFAVAPVSAEEPESSPRGELAKDSSLSPKGLESSASRMSVQKALPTAPAKSGARLGPSSSPLLSRMPGRGTNESLLALCH